MKTENCFRGSLYGLFFFLLALPVSLVAQNQPPQAPLKDYSKSVWFPNVLSPYRAHDIPAVRLENSPRVTDLIHDGKLEISMADALALAIENNLDISVEREVLPMAQTDFLRAQAGQAARGGFTGVSIPLGLNAGAIGLGVSTAVQGGGVGNAGGITGGGATGYIVPPVGTFDPTINYNFSWDRTTSPLNTVVVAGIPAITQYSTSYSGSYTQMLPTGTSYFLSLNGLRTSSTQQNLLFDPNVATRMAFGVNQPLLNGFGRGPNERFLVVAKNNEEISGENFRNQVNQTIVQVENAYWDMAQFQANVKVAQDSLETAKLLYDDSKKQEAVGIMSPLDVLSAESQVAASQRDLVMAQTNLQLQEITLKNLLSKRPEPLLTAARILTTDALPPPRDGDIPALESALAEAYRNRSDLKIAKVNVRNEMVSAQYTANDLLPTANVFGQYAAAGLQGNCAVTAKSTCGASLPVGTVVPSGVLSSLDQMISGNFPEYSFGINMTIPLRNRSAQADNLRAQLETQQSQITLQSLQNQIDLGVRQALVGLVQGKAQVEAAHEAAVLAQQTLVAEKEKLAAGVSTYYNVTLRQRDLASAQYAEVQALDAYAKALVAMDQARGQVLERNGITFDDALRGTINQMPAPAFHRPAPDGR